MWFLLRVISDSTWHTRNLFLSFSFVKRHLIFIEVGALHDVCRSVAMSSTVLTYGLDRRRYMQLARRHTSPLNADP